MSPTAPSNTSEQRLKQDKILLIILLAHLPVTMFLVPLGYDTMGFAIGASLLVAALVGIGYATGRGTRLFGMIAAVALMAYSAIMIQSQLGRIEMHFHIFAGDLIHTS